MGRAATETERAADGQPVKTFEAFFSNQSRETVRFALPLIGGLHAFAAAVYWLTAPYEQALGLAVFSILVTVAAGAAAGLLARDADRRIGADGLTTCVILLASCSALSHLQSAWSPLAVAAAALLVVSCGLLCSSRHALILVPVAVQGWWAALASADGWSSPWMQLEIALLAASAASWACYRSRRSTAMQLFESEQRFATFAQRDVLTNLPTRSAVLDRLGERFARASRNPYHTFGLCVLNLDGFRKVNERYGHSTGDLLLQTVAERLRLASRRSDIVARLGGDEFVIFLEDAPTPEHADAGADRLCGLAGATVDLDGISLKVNATYGVAWSGSAYESEEAMLSAAHGEMQAAKSRHRAVARAVAAQRRVQASRETHALAAIA